MGVSIFIMANFLGISYQTLMVKAIPPAFIYMVLCSLGALLIARRENLEKITVKTNFSVIAKGIWVFIIPMTVLVFLLVNLFSPGFAAYITLGVLLCVGFLSKATRPRLGKFIDGMANGVKIVASIAIVCAAVGIFVKVLIMTGAGIKLASLIETLSGGNLLIALFLTMVLSMIMGCALPTVPAYAIVALVVAPALVKMGVNQILAHFFVFYYAVLAVITPPVAPGSIVASKLANASFLSTSWESIKLAGPFFLVPYFIIYNPLLVLEPANDFVGILLAILGLIIACGALMFALQKWCLVKASLAERLLLIAAAVLATVFSINQNRWYFSVAAVIFGGIILFQYKKLRARVADNS
jgi:TRAP-type uncharacterized transport system fused permease subunit